MKVMLSSSTVSSVRVQRTKKSEFNDVIVIERIKSVQVLCKETRVSYNGADHFAVNC